MANVQTWSDFVREPTSVFAHLARGPVELHRRDGEDLVIGLKSTMESSFRGSEIAAHLFAVLLAVVFKSQEQVAAKALSDTFPWARLLPTADVQVFARELSETLEACASIGNMAPLGELISDWKATAAIHADPKLVAELKRPIPVGPTVTVKRPRNAKKK